MKNKHTQGHWSINHWNNNGTSGVTCHGQKNGVSFFSGDAVKDVNYKVVGHRDINSTLDGSFEGLHIAHINDRGLESMANAKLIAAAPVLLEQLQSIIDGSAFDKETGLIWQHRLTAIEDAVKLATE